MNVPPENLLHAFDGPRLVDTVHGPVELRTISVGDLILTTGEIMAGDPLYVSEAFPFTMRFPPGNYPVEAVLARFGDDERIACIRVRLTEQPTTRLEISEAGSGGVDNAAWCFADRQAAAALSTFTEEQFNVFWSRMRERMGAVYAPTRSWAVLPVNDDLTANLAICESGWGDGSYASYYAFSADEAVAALVTDFEVLITAADVEAAKASRPWWRFW